MRIASSHCLIPAAKEKEDTGDTAGKFRKVLTYRGKGASDIFFTSNHSQCRCPYHLSQSGIIDYSQTAGQNREFVINPMGCADTSDNAFYPLSDILL